MQAKCAWLLAAPLVVVSAVPAMAGPSRANPYSNLFQARDLKAVARAQQLREVEPQRPRLHCQTGADGVRYCIRSVEPPDVRK